MDAARAAAYERRRPILGPGLAPELVALLRDCWHPTPSSRPIFEVRCEGTGEDKTCFGLVLREEWGTRALNCAEEAASLRVLTAFLPRFLFLSLSLLSLSRHPSAGGDEPPRAAGGEIRRGGGGRGRGGRGGQRGGRPGLRVRHAVRPGRRGTGAARRIPSGYLFYCR